MGNLGLKKVYQGKDVMLVTKLTKGRMKNTTDAICVHAGLDSIYKEGCCFSRNRTHSKDKVDDIMKSNEKATMIMVYGKNEDVYLADIIEIKINQSPVLSPYPKLTPEYYRDKKYKIWYRIENIRLCEDEGLLDRLVLKDLITDENENKKFNKNTRNSFWYVIDKDKLA